MNEHRWEQSETDQKYGGGEEKEGDSIPDGVLLANAFEPMPALQSSLPLLPLFLLSVETDSWVPLSPFLPGLSGLSTRFRGSLGLPGPWKGRQRWSGMVGFSTAPAPSVPVGRGVSPRDIS